MDATLLDAEEPGTVGRLEPQTVGDMSAICISVEI